MRVMITLGVDAHGRPREEIRRAIEETIAEMWHVQAPLGKTNNDLPILINNEPLDVAILFDPIDDRLDDLEARIRELQS